MRSALGKGLNALISEDTAASVAAAAPPSTAAGITILRLDQIQPNPKQPRRQIHEQALHELSSSIAEKGVLQPILVIAIDGGKYEIIAGERRWRAAARAGLSSIPAVVRSGTEAERFELALIENVQRENLNPVDQAEGYRRLQQEFAMTQEQIARVIGKDRAVIANTLRLLNLPEQIRAAVASERISMGHARALLAIDDAAAQQALFQRILDEELSVRHVEQAAKDHKRRRQTTGTQSTALRPPAPEVKQIEEELQRHLGRKVELSADGPDAHHGWLRFEFYSLDDLENLLNQLRTILPGS